MHQLVLKLDNLNTNYRLSKIATTSTCIAISPTLTKCCSIYRTPCHCQRRWRSSPPLASSMSPPLFACLQSDWTVESAEHCSLQDVYSLRSMWALTLWGRVGMGGNVWALTLWGQCVGVNSVVVWRVNIVSKHIIGKAIELLNASWNWRIWTQITGSLSNYQWFEDTFQQP